MTCYVPFCKSNRSRGRAIAKEKGISFHEFPVDPVLREKWIKTICRKGKDGGYWSPCETAFVCSRHFDASSYKEGFKIRLLKKGSVPNVFEDYPEHRRPKSKAPTQRKQQKSHLSKNMVHGSVVADLTAVHHFQDKDSLSILADECDKQNEITTANIEYSIKSTEMKSVLTNECIKQSTNAIDLAKFHNGNSLSILANEGFKQSENAIDVEDRSTKKYSSNITQTKSLVENEYVKQCTNAVNPMAFRNYSKGCNQNRISAVNVKKGCAGGKINVTKATKALLARQYINQNPVAVIILGKTSDVDENCLTETRDLSNKGVNESTIAMCNIENTCPLKTFKCVGTQTMLDSQKLDLLKTNTRMFQKKLYAYKTIIENLKDKNNKLKRKINIYEKLSDWLNKD